MDQYVELCRSTSLVLLVAAAGAFVVGDVATRREQVDEAKRALQRLIDADKSRREVFEKEVPALTAEELAAVFEWKRAVPGSASHNWALSVIRYRSARAEKRESRAGARRRSDAVYFGAVQRNLGGWSCSANIDTTVRAMLQRHAKPTSRVPVVDLQALGSAFQKYVTDCERANVKPESLQVYMVEGPLPECGEEGATLRLHVGQIDDGPALDWKECPPVIEAPVAWTKHELRASGGADAQTVAEMRKALVKGDPRILDMEEASARDMLHHSAATASDELEIAGMTIQAKWSWIFYATLLFLLYVRLIVLYLGIARVEGGATSVWSGLEPGLAVTIVKILIVNVLPLTALLLMSDSRGPQLVSPTVIAMVAFSSLMEVKFWTGARAAYAKASKGA